MIQAMKSCTSLAKKQQMINKVLEPKLPPFIVLLFLYFINAQQQTAGYSEVQHS